MADLVKDFSLEPKALGHLTSAVQFGFIAGTLSFAFLTIADRFSPSKVFFFSALAGAIFNLGVILNDNSLISLIIFRALTGFSLAGIYPVGMKIASDYFEKGLGRSLGFLVGALVIGTAFPHLLKDLSGVAGLLWKLVIYLTSGIALLGGFLIFIFVPNGPYRSALQKPDFMAFFRVFNNRDFRGAAFGYFGHMWELYAFWAFVPVILAYYRQTHPQVDYNISLLSFSIIGVGGIACMAGGLISERLGTKNTAGLALFFSGFCCLLSPVIFFTASKEGLISFLIFWGLMVVADSPLFSTLVARNAPASSRGTALTIVNCVGFAITILSIQLLNFLLNNLQPYYLFMILATDPALGLFALFKKPGPIRKSH